MIPDFVLSEDFTREVRAAVQPLPSDDFWLREAMQEWMRRNPVQWDDFKVKPCFHYAGLVVPPKSFGYYLGNLAI